MFSYLQKKERKETNTMKFCKNNRMNNKVVNNHEITEKVGIKTTIIRQ